MGKIIGRINWVAVETSTGSQTAGQKVVLLEDVVVTAMQKTRRDKERLKICEPLRMNPADTSKILEELRGLEASSDPSLNEVLTVLYRKILRLDSVYALSYGEHLDPHLRGFGLGAGREGEMTFSWEWFNITSSNSATKLQESGELTYEVKTTALGQELAYLRFETDVSLRLVRTQAELGNVPYRLNILKGSEIYLPSLIGGQLVSNGFVP